MILEKKHIAPYLPFDLQVNKQTYKNGTSQGTYTMTEDAIKSVLISVNKKYENQSYYPILKRIDRLSNEEKIPLGLIIREIEISKATYKDKIFAIEDASMYIRDGMKPTLSIQQCKDIIEYLYSIHVDLNNLIDLGLALDKDEMIFYEK